MKRIYTSAADLLEKEGDKKEFEIQIREVQGDE